uniref:Uncharacterized protein n=1 Tax=Aegilops tauschii subsp. strangulata TaxID=200361 RepID=A0A453CDW5_AEGTS
MLNCPPSHYTLHVAIQKGLVTAVVLVYSRKGFSIISSQQTMKNIGREPSKLILRFFLSFDGMPFSINVASMISG